jgi:SAM-dependent methyltransferase
MHTQRVRPLRRWLALFSGLALLAASTPGWAQERDVPYVPTPEAVVLEMLRLAGVTKDDVVYDLGSGDGRIVIAAAQRFGARGVGIDIDPDRVAEATANARRAGVADRATFRRQDLFEADIREATVVTMYLLPGVNERLRPKLLGELRPGTRLVSHAFDMGDWKPERVVEAQGSTLYYWVIPSVVPSSVDGTRQWRPHPPDQVTRPPGFEIDRRVAGLANARSTTLADYVASLR